MTVGLVGHYLGAKMGIGVFLDRLLEPLMTTLSEQGIEATVIASPNALRQTPAIARLQQTFPTKVKVLPPLDDPPLKRFTWIATQFSSYCQQQGINQIIWLSNPMILPWHPPSIAVLHDVNEWKAKEKYGSQIKTTLRSWMYLEASIRWAKKIICVSEATTADLLHFRPHPRVCQKVQTIPNGLDSPLANLAPARADLPNAPFLLSVGRIDPAGKKLPEAIALTRALRTLSGHPWEIHLMGGMNNSTRQAGEAFVQSIAPLPWASYHGYTEDKTLAAWYAKATAVVFLSKNEGFGSPVAEAASFGKRVIVNEKNQATLGAGGDAVIPILPSQSDKDNRNAALRVLEQLSLNSSKQAPRPSLYTYADAAIAYAQEIAQILSPT